MEAACRYNSSASLSLPNESSQSAWNSEESASLLRRVCVEGEDGLGQGAAEPISAALLAYFRANVNCRFWYASPASFKYLSTKYVTSLRSFWVSG